MRYIVVCLVGLSSFLVSCGVSQLADGGKGRYVTIGNVTCREPIEEIAVDVNASANASYGLFGAGGKASYSEQVKRLDNLPTDFKIRERIEFKVCMDYGNNLISKEEYKLWSLLLQGDEQAKLKLHELAIGEQRMAANEVLPPTDCRESSLAEAKQVFEVQELLAGGTAGAKRAQDDQALTLLERYTKGSESSPLWAQLARARLYTGAGAVEVAQAAQQASSLCPRYAVPDNYLGTARFLSKELARG